MKKFISLVLALVMALSLTTVAWGATTHEVSTEAQLAELLDENGTNDVAEGDTIKLLNNIVVTTPMHTTNGVSYTGDKSFTIDFNNCIVSAGSSITNAVFRIKTSGTVTLKNGTITASDMFYAVLANGTGTINLDNMTISLTNTGGQGVAVNAYAGTVNVNDGTEITATGAYAGMEVYGTANIYEGSTVSYLNDVPAPNTYGSIGSAVGTSGGGTLNIYGGELVSTATGGNTVATNTSGGTISIMGGTITGETAVYAYTDANYGIPADVSIIGGTINGALKEKALGATSTEVVVKGGTFDDADAKDYLADGATATIAGKTVFKNPGGGTVANPVAQVGNTKYETLAAAVAAAASAPDKTVTMMADAELTAELELPEGVKLDGQNKTISIAESAKPWPTTVPGKHMMHLGKDTVVKNVTFDSENEAYGVQAYCVTGVKLENVSIINSKGAGLTVNGATVDAVNLKASGNAWGSVNVDPGTGVTTVSKFTISGDNTKLSDATTIYGDDPVAATDPKVDITISGGTYNGAIDVPAAAGDVEITGGTFTTDVSDYLAAGLFQNANGSVASLPTSVIPKGGSTLTPNFNDRTKPQYASWDAKVIKKDAEDAKKFKFATYTIEMYAEINNAPIWWGNGGIEKDKGEKVKFTYGGEKEFVEVSPEVAEFMIVEGKTITYFARASVFNEDGWDEKATATKLSLRPDAVADMKCNTYYITDAADSETSFFWYEGALYAPAAAYELVFNVGGVVYAVAEVDVFDATRIDDTLTDDTQTADRVIYTSHNYVIEIDGDTYGNADVSKVSCDICKKSFGFTPYGPIAATEKFGEYGWFELIDGLWVEKSARSSVTVRPTGGTASDTASDSTITDKVTSAGTFDAGIAMYVGMSVMAAAGSAVVLKKKD